MKHIINNDWEYTSVFTDEFLNGARGEKTVRIPHTVKELPLHYIDPDDYQMISGYRKTVFFPENDGKRRFLHFEGAAHIADVWFNGEQIMHHACGYTAFEAEITKQIRYGEENVITVHLDSSENGSIPPFGFVIDYLTYGGIYRDVWIDERPAAMIKDVFVSVPDLSSVKLEIRYETDQKNRSALIEILDDAGTVMASCESPLENRTVTLHVPDAQSWSPEHPAMYTARVSIMEENGDVQEYPFGFRTVSITGNEFLLNGKPYFIRGLNRHQCWPYAGYAVPEGLQREDARILKEELKVNAVRTSHYPDAQSFIDACDRLGLLVFTEIPGWQHIGDRSWKMQAIENTKEMVLQYRNHPSIVIWGVRINESMDDDDFYRATNEMARRLDPTRPTSGVRYLEKSSLLEDIYGFNDFSHNGITPGAKHKKDVMKDTGHPLLITESNGHMFPVKSYDSWEKRQEHALRHARVLNAAAEDKEHIGCFQWCMFDYATHKDFGSGDRICYHGVLDSFRNPKLAAALYASQSDDEPVLEIGSPMDIGDYPAGNISGVYAFTNADEVRLYKNEQYVSSFKAEGWNGLAHGPVLIDDFIGDLLKTNEGFEGNKEKLIHETLQAAARYGAANLPLKYQANLAWVMLRYHMKYEDGAALFGKYVGSWGGDAVVWKFEAVKDGKVVKTVKRTPCAKLHLETACSHTELHEGDTYDMAAIRIRILDENGNIAPYAQLPVTIKVSGPCEIAGPSVVTAEGGMCGTYIRTTGEEGTAVIELHADTAGTKIITLPVTRR